MPPIASHATLMPPVVPVGTVREDAIDFIRWALAQLQIEVREGEGELIVELPEAERGAFAGQPQVRLPRRGAAQAGQESLDWNGRFGRWLASRLARLQPAHARPAGQPMAVADLSGKLFSAYHIEGGRVHLAGCQLTDHPFLRLTYAADEKGDGSLFHVRHVFVAPDGSSISAALAPQLGLDHLEPIVKAPPRIEPAALRALEAAARRTAALQSTEHDPAAATAEPLAVAVVWVRHAEGRLQFTIGSAAAFAPFSSWARLLAAPPYESKHTGARAFRLAATDDGRIDAADQIAVCAQSGRRVLRQELVECSVTGKLVLPDFIESCPVSGRGALRGEFAGCTVCRQRVSKRVLDEGVCAACRTLSKGLKETKVTKDDPRLVWIFGDHPGLDRWKHWQLAETQTAYVAQAAGLLKRLLVVVDKETLVVRRLATAGRVGANWVDLTDAARDEVLK
jgi:hypothetical protein